MVQTYMGADDDRGGSPPGQIHPERLLPTWWLILIAMYGMPQAVCNLFDIIVFPDRVAHLAGDAHKHALLGALMSMRGCVHMALPLVGTATDTVLPVIGRWGRRRPILMVGCACLVVGLTICKFSRDTATFSAGYAVYCVGCMVGWVPYTAVIPDLVPLSQRASASAWQSALQSVGGACVCVYTVHQILLPQRDIITEHATP